MSEAYPRTPDGRYFVVRGRLWRLSDPSLPADVRDALVHELMAARRAVRDARIDPSKVAAARSRVDGAKRALGERGPPWWTDGAPDYNRQMAIDTPYEAWYRGRLEAGDDPSQRTGIAGRRPGAQRVSGSGSSPR